MFLLDLLFPPRCAVCLEIIPVTVPVSWLCADHAGELSANEACGVVDNYSLFIYTGRERDIIRNFKYEFGPPMGGFMKGIIEKYADLDKLRGFDCYVPVPLHKKKQNMRGFNQAIILANALSEIVGIASVNSLLRIKNTLPQSGLDSLERRENIKDAFIVDDSLKGSVEGKYILLVDDIYTTGSTMNECAKTLKAAGAKRVRFFSFCGVENAP